MTTFPRPWLALLVLEALSPACAGPHAAARAGAADRPSREQETSFAEGAPAAAPSMPGAAVARRARPGPRLALAEGAAPAAGGRTSAPVEAEPEAPKGDKLLVYTADLTIAVFEVRRALDEAVSLADDLGGYLVSRTDRGIAVRVPAARFREAVARMSKLGDLLRQNVNAQDVTDEFFDLEVRLKNARAVRERLEKLLAHSQNVNDALAVERELARVAEEVERLQGQLARMRELVAYSTVRVQFDVPPAEPVDPTVRLPFPWLDTLGLANLLRLDR